MKYSIVKKISNTEIARATITLADECNNGADCFGYTCDIFDIRGNRNEAKITFEGRIYRESGMDTSKEFMVKHFAELEPIFILNGCDIKGLPSYPLMNGEYWLENHFETAIKTFRISKDEAEMVKNFKPLSFAKFLFNLTETRYKVEVKNAITLIESLSKEKYKIKDVISKNLYNDLHYVMITEKEGWNIYKDKKNKKDLEYCLDLSK